MIFLALALFGGSYYIYNYILAQKHGGDYTFEITDLAPEMDHIILWTDTVLESRIRECINKKEGDIYLSDIWYCQALNLSRTPIIDNNLKTVTFSEDPITDISNLAGLKNLRTLDLTANMITDISAVGSMDNLKVLLLYGNPLRDISAIESLTQLKNLNLNSTHLQGEELEHLLGLKNLSFLYLDFNEIESLEALKIPKVSLLSLRGNQIVDITPLTELHESLLWLDLSDNQISDISSLTKLKKVYYLDLAHNQLTKLPDFSKMKSLGTLYLDENQIPTEEWENVKLPCKIQLVNISGNPINDLKTERMYPNLEVQFDNK